MHKDYTDRFGHDMAMRNMTPASERRAFAKAKNWHLGGLEFPLYTAMVRALFKKMPRLSGSILHAATGIAGEAGEVLDAAKKHWVYERPLDMQNILEELGDIYFYDRALQILCPFYGDYVTGLIGKRHGALGQEPEVVEQYTRAMFFHAGALLDLVGTAHDDYEDQIRDPGALLQYFSENIKFFRYVHIKLLDLIQLFGYTVEEVEYANQFKLIGPGGRYESGTYSNEQAAARADKS